jgi:hypothetical protein
MQGRDRDLTGAANSRYIAPQFWTAVELTPNEIAADLAARRELGPEYEDAIAASMADRIEREIAARVDAGRIPAKLERREHEPHSADRSATFLAAASLVAGIPITGVAGTNNGNVFALGVAWLGIVLVNTAHALDRRDR